METKAEEYASYLVDSLALPVWSMDTEGVHRIADSFMRGELVALMRIQDSTNQNVLFEAHESALDDLLFKERPIRTLLASGYSIDGQAAEILERGCSDFIQKPFTLDALSRKIRSILDSPAH